MAVIGVDAGGSKIIAAVATDDGGMLSVSRTEACGNHQITSPPEAMREIGQAIAACLRGADLTPGDVRQVCLGVAGADHEWDLSVLRKAAADVLPYPEDRVDIVCDTVLGLRLLSPELSGCVLVAGSDTNVFGRNEDGACLQIGGMGYMFGDYGGGYRLSVEVARAVFRAWDGRGPQTRLTELVLAATGHAAVDDLYEAWLRGRVGEAPIELTKVLFTAAQGHDAVATGILRDAGREYGCALEALLRRLPFRQTPVPVIGIGGLLTARDSPLLASIRERLRDSGLNCRFSVAAEEPIAGAVRLAVDRIRGSRARL
ncbi:MAG: ATPase [Firmicutes bacterium]|nr:ATPase [Bacillota bacterium]